MIGLRALLIVMKSSACDWFKGLMEVVHVIGLRAILIVIKSSACDWLKGHMDCYEE